MGNKKGKIIGIFGPGRCGADSWEWQIAEEVGRLLANAGCHVLTGGLGGVMTAACKGASDEGGTTIGILPGTRKNEPANPYVDIPIYTGMGEARNVINVKSCDGAIAIGGEYGTLSEIALALKEGCPLALIRSWRLAKEDGDLTGIFSAPDAATAAAHILSVAGNSP